VDFCIYIYIYVSREPWRGRVRAGASSGPIEAVDSETCVKGNNRPFQRPWSVREKQSPSDVSNVMTGEHLDGSLLWDITY
jgi:hypothetical protein